ncbi:glycosyltransferase, partial [candidate division KSB3 bacterium]|nr:glycosyltransferase [candidate division KSB3 bacterium]MBD3323307.1 glycosyltransferase [candidate division KSB3 bacterium]
MPRVSVIIPTYNRAAFLKTAIDSVLNQTYPDFELLVIDDGSTDHTPQVIDQYDSRLTYHVQSNHGVSHARNVGIRASSGEYIAFLDSDDAWLPHKLDQQIAVMTEHPDLQLCHTEEIWIRRGVRVNPKKKHQKPFGYIFPYCLPLCVVSPSAVMLRRTLFETVGDFDEMLPACEDYDLWLRISKDYPVHLLETPLLIKQGGHADQLSRLHWGIDRFRIRSLEKLLQAGNLTVEQRQQTLRELRRKCAIFANGCRKRRKIEQWKY